MSLYTVDTPIVHAPTGTLAEALAWLDIKTGPETEYATELWRLAPLVGLDPCCLFGQAALETGDFSSPVWSERLNPAGIGWTGDPVQNAASFIWKTGTDAARAHVVHMAMYTIGRKQAELTIGDYIQLDPRADAVYAAGYAMQARTLNDLTGRWAVDPRYAEKIAAKLNYIFQDSRIQNQEVHPVSTITFGLVPYPSVVQSILPASNPYVQESGAPDIPEAIFWHRMIGTWDGTDDWFHQGNAATAYGVGVSATDGATMAGKIYEWIKPRNGWYGESSGPVKVPYGDGLIYANEVGAANVNRLSKAIEISGDVDTLLDEKARAAIAAMTAYWADQKGIPWTEFPLYKAKNRSYVIWHNEITGMAYKTCPGAVVMAETPALIERTKQLMKQYQEGAAVPEPEKPKYTTPLPVPFKEGDYGWKKLGDVSVYCLQAEVEIVRATTPLAWADGDKSDGTKAPNAGPKLKQGERVKVIGSFYNLNEKGQTVRWLIRASDNARIIGSSCRPLLPIKQ